MDESARAPGAEPEADPIAPLFRRAAITGRVGALIEAIRDGDEHMVEDAVLSFSLEVEIDGMWPWNRWRALAPPPTGGS